MSRLRRDTRDADLMTDALPGPFGADESDVPATRKPRFSLASRAMRAHPVASISVLLLAGFTFVVTFSILRGAKHVWASVSRRDAVPSAAISADMPAPVHAAPPDPGFLNRDEVERIVAREVAATIAKHAEDHLAVDERQHAPAQVVRAASIPAKDPSSLRVVTSKTAVPLVAPADASNLESATAASLRSASERVEPRNGKKEQQKSDHDAALVAHAAVGAAEAAVEQNVESKVIAAPDREIVKVADNEKSLGSRAAGQPPANAAAVCYRTYDAGKLGSDEPLCVTDEFFFDISIGGDDAGRLVIGVFGTTNPKSAANFRALATCKGAFSDPALCYRGDSFHRIVKDFVIQGGHKATARSIYGDTFREEMSAQRHSVLSHTEKGAVSWAEYPIGSQFFILTKRPAVRLDANHVLFGFVTDGMDVLDKVAHVNVEASGMPLERVDILYSGDLHDIEA
jgi:cyclophilin family peptidyl-prolyl cis-trans isomerase